MKTDMRKTNPGTRELAKHNVFAIIDGKAIHVFGPVDRMEALRVCSGMVVEATTAPEGKKLVPCDGAAHSNAYIDNCGRCAPRWGWIEIPAQFETLQDYLKSQGFPAEDK